MYNLCLIDVVAMLEQGFMALAGILVKAEGTQAFMIT
jgi:hypothetical protein